MEKQINITSEIVSRIDALGYPCKEGSQDCMIVTNFVKSNLTKLLGDTILNENDFELNGATYKFVGWVDNYSSSSYIDFNNILPISFKIFINKRRN